ncbi:hypothetical protein [Pseudoalteromonas obscura]|uniref:Uncharacterized protein n=1 Tax=Pseudoalteromonas obscura TaxID=3048491 RepID=A0ABT7EK58_9GAMM|nr:hypothetical protein [Pseudoalteromonas sp. P94(2023)]MDK2595425.1 hypothetical protein [Pseudoalteromonas sp. P94(2023)]
MNLDVDWPELLIKALPDAQGLINNNEIEKIPRFFLANNLQFVRNKNGQTFKALSEAIEQNSNSSITLHFSNISRIEKMEIDATVSSVFKLSVGLGLEPICWHQLCSPLGFDDDLHPITLSELNSGHLTGCIIKAYQGMSSVSEMNIPKLTAMSVAGNKAKVTGDFAEFENKMFRIASM